MAVAGSEKTNGDSGGNLQSDCLTLDEVEESGVDLMQDLTLSGMTPASNDDDDAANNAAAADASTTAAAKKKKKKKSKKSSKLAANASAGPGAAGTKEGKEALAYKPPVLCISRNKHWKYISSYHGPWLQLPVELLQSLVLLNLEPGTVSSSAARHQSFPPPSLLPPPGTPRKAKEKGFASLGSPASSDDAPITLSTSSSSSSLSLPPSPLPPLPPPAAGKAVPPPIDPGVFRNVAAIRALIDSAAELAVRASSGLSAAALSAQRNGGGGGGGGSSWAAVQALGLSPLVPGMGAGAGGGGEFGGGRVASMSPTMVHRLRVLAVQKLAEAYKLDEIASSVMVMQGGSVFDDIAERVLRIDPNNFDARYVHFFHERIPSRQLAEFTPTTVLDQLIQQSPNHLHYYRTRGIVHGFRDEYALAVKDFTHALKESRAARRARLAHNNNNAYGISDGQQRGKRKKKKINGQAPPNGTAPFIEGPDGEQIFIHKSVLPDAPDPLEPQLLFHRAASYLSHAVFLIESALFKLEGVEKGPSGDLGEIRLSYVRNGRYGGTEIGNPDGPLGRSDGEKARAYREVLDDPVFREQVMALVRKSKRDFERFLAQFDTLEATPEDPDPSDYAISTNVERGFQLLGAFRPSIGRASTTTAADRYQQSASSPTSLMDVPLSFTTYHPLMVEAHFGALTCMLILGEFEPLASHTFARTAHLVAGLEGYPVFLPPRSMAQAEFMEVLERLAGGWKYAKYEDALVVRSAAKAPCRPPLPVGPEMLRAAHARAVEGLEGLRASPVASSSSSAGPSGSRSQSTSGRASPDPAPCTSSSPSSSSFVPPHEDVEARSRTNAQDVGALQALRLLLAPVRARQTRVAAEATNGKTSSAAGLGLGLGAGTGAGAGAINITLHGPRVEIVLAWIAAVHLPGMETVAESF